MENKKKNNILLIVVIVVISLLLVGTLAYFTYDKIFKEDKPVEENKDNKDNTNNDNENKTGVKMNASYDNSTILKSLVDIRYIVEDDYYDETMFKIDENKKLVVTYYDEEEEKDVTKRFDEIGNVTKIIHYGDASGMAIIFTGSNEIYFFHAYDDEDKIKKIDNNTGKKPKALYQNQVNGDLYVCFDDDSLIELNVSDLKLGKNIRDMNLFIGGLNVIDSPCGNFCSPSSVRIYGDGTVEYVSEGAVFSDSHKYSTVKYNGETLDIKYIYHDEGKLINLYFVDNNNDVYLIPNYVNFDEGEISKNIKIEKASYKFNSLKTSKQKNEYNYTETIYTVKFADGSTKTIDGWSFEDLTDTYHTTLFNLYKNSKKSS